MSPSTHFPIYTPTQAASKTRYVPMLGIVVAHIVFFYALQLGKMHIAAPILAKEVTINLIQTQQSKPEIPQPNLRVPEKLTAPPTPTMVPPEVPTFAIASTSESVISVPVTPHSPVVAPAEAAPTNTPVAVPQTKVISAVEYIRSPQADYPPLAKRMGEEGKVVMRVLVNEKGRAEKVEIQKSSGFNRLDEAARIAVMRALFKPYIEDGKPLVVLATATINFSLSS